MAQGRGIWLRPSPALLAKRARPSGKASCNAATVSADDLLTIMTMPKFKAWAESCSNCLRIFARSFLGLVVNASSNVARRLSPMDSAPSAILLSSP